MILTRKNLIYFGFALVVGTIFAFGISSLTYQPVPLQVTENPYTPALPPSPSVTVLPPQYVPGSYADANKNTTGDPYAPAPAPVIVTTAPLPSITPAQTPQAAGKNPCGGLNPAWNQTLQNVNSQTQSAFAVAAVIPIGIVGIGVLMIVIGMFGGESFSISSPFKSKATKSINIATSGQVVGTSSIVWLIVASGGVLVVLYIIGIVLGNLSNQIICQ